MSRSIGGNDRADPIGASRRTLIVIVAATSVVGMILAAFAPAVVGGDRAILTLPTLFQSALILLSTVTLLTLRTGLRVDALMLFIMWETLRGCVAPVILMYVGPAESGFYYRLGTWADARSVLFLGNLFFVVVVVVRVTLAMVEQSRQKSRAALLPATCDKLTPGGIPASALILLGLIGLTLRFPSGSAISGFLAGDVDALQSNDVIAASGLLLASLYLRPLLVVGLVMVIWKRHQEKRRIWPIVPVLLISAIFALASYGLNRGTVAYAAIALVLVFFERSTRTIRLSASLGGIALLGSFFVVVGSLRSSLWVGRSGLDSAPMDVPSVLRSVLSYAGSPLQLSAIVPTVEQASPFGIRSFALSLLSPLPGAPDVSRTQSGMAIYNNIAYHSYVGKDQLLPTWFEGWLSFGIVGVVIIAILTSVTFAVADGLRRNLRTPLGLYGATLLTIWIAQAGVTGTSVIEQNILNFALPPLVLAAIGQIRKAPDETPHAFRNLQPKRRVPRHAHGRNSGQSPG